jgi:DNA-binding GntR family transcriptional regulator
MAEMKEGPIKDWDLGTMPGRKSLGQHVFENLKQAIIRGEVAPGDRLVESRLADALDISRTPVREAIHKLEREGLLRRLPKGGFAVMNLSREDIEETFGIRCVLESYAARLAAQNYSEEELLPLEEKLREFQRLLDKGRLDELPRINTEFHNILYALSRSPKLIKMINDLRDQIYRFRRILLEKDKWAEASNNDHQKMLEAIRERNVNRVEKVVKQHIARGRRIVLNALEQRISDS